MILNRKLNLNLLCKFLIMASLLIFFSGCNPSGDSGCDPSLPVVIVEGEGNFDVTVNCQWVRNYDDEVDWLSKGGDLHLMSIVALASASTSIPSASIYAMYFAPEQYIGIAEIGLKAIAEYEIYEYEHPREESGMEAWQIVNKDNGNSGLIEWVNDKGQKGYSFTVHNYVENTGDVHQTIDMYIDDEKYVYVLMVSTSMDAGDNDEFVTIRESFHINANIIDPWTDEDYSSVSEHYYNRDLD